MLALDAPRWQSLSHAYGDATDVPAMLRQLEHDTEDAWDLVWGSLCHQGSVYTASYAAVPHLVDLAARVPASAVTRARCLAFVGHVALASDAAPIPDDLREDYLAAQQRARPLVVQALAARPSSRSTVASLLLALAALDGDRDLALILEGFEDGDLHLRCPRSSCQVDLVAQIVGDTLHVARETAAGDPVGRRTTVVPALHARTEVHPDVAAALALIEGATTCPVCREQFVLRVALRDA